MKNPIWLMGPLAALAMSACSGGGGGDGSSAPPTSSNMAPTITGLSGELSVLKDASSDPVAFEIGDDTTATDALQVSVTSSDEALLPPGGIQLGGYGSNRTLLLVPEPGKSGTATVTVSVRDTAGSVAKQTFGLDVTTEERSFHDFAVTSIDVSSEAEPAEVAGADWVETEEDDPAAFDPILAAIAE